MLRRCETCPSDIDEELLAELKDWRLRTAKEMNVPAYVVFTDNTLIAIAETLPGDDAALVAIPGIGARKLEQFGPDVLALVRKAVLKTANSRKDHAKTAGQKIACQFRVLTFNSQIRTTGRPSTSREEGVQIMVNFNAFPGVSGGVAGMSWTLHVSGSAAAAAHPAPA